MAPSLAFHYAFPVKDLEATRRFYAGLLGCTEGRSTDKWVDFDFFGHQLSAHLHPDHQHDIKTSTVDGKAVPLHHFGAVLEWDDWQQLAEKLKNAGTDFIIDPQARFKGLPGEQATMFFKDPSGNALEFKAFRREEEIFARQ